MKWYHLKYLTTELFLRGSCGLIKEIKITFPCILDLWECHDFKRIFRWWIKAHVNVAWFVSAHGVEGFSQQKLMLSSILQLLRDKAHYLDNPGIDEPWVLRVFFRFRIDQRSSKKEMVPFAFWIFDLYKSDHKGRNFLLFEALS